MQVARAAGREGQVGHAAAAVVEARVPAPVLGELSRCVTRRGQGNERQGGDEAQRLGLRRGGLLREPERGAASWVGFFYGWFQGSFDAAARALDEPPKVAVAMLVYPNTKNFAQPNEISESEREAGC